MWVWLQTTQVRDKVKREGGVEVLEEVGDL